MKKGVKIVIVLLILLGVAFLVGRRLLKPKEEVEITQLPLATGISVEKGDLFITESLVGTIEASEQYALASKVSGEVLEIYAENGAELKKGDKIARLDNQKQIDAAKYTLEQAEAQAKAASDARNRLASLQASGDISTQDFEAADAQPQKDKPNKAQASPGAERRQWRALQALRGEPGAAHGKQAPH